MGAPLTKQRGVCVRGKNETRKYVPLTPYKPFPEERRKAPGELISQFPAFPAAPEPVLSKYFIVIYCICTTARLVFLKALYFCYLLELIFNFYQSTQTKHASPCPNHITTNKVNTGLPPEK